MKQLWQEKERLHDLLEDQLGELRCVGKIGNVEHTPGVIDVISATGNAM